MYTIFASILNALVGLVRLVIFCRKTEKDMTEKDMFEELDFVMESALYSGWGHEIAPKDVRKWFASLPPKYNDPKYYNLKVHVYRKMKADGRLVHIFDFPSRRKKTE